MPKNPLGLYIHIPFCQAKCAYCDFYSMSGSGEALMQRYVDALISQMETYSHAAKEYVVNTIFIGGGTPTTLPVTLMCKLIDGIKKNFNIARGAEFTMEANPATVTRAALAKYRKKGVNRLSIGLQSASNEELAYGIKIALLEILDSVHS